MQAIDFVAGKTLEQFVGQHGSGAAQAFFGGLEDEHDTSREVARLGQIARGAQQHRRMPVVSTPMKLARHGRFVGHVGRFVHGEGVHVGAQAYAAPGAMLTFQNTDHACLAYFAMNLDAPARQ